MPLALLSTWVVLCARDLRLPEACSNREFRGRAGSYSAISLGVAVCIAAMLPLTGSAPFVAVLRSVPVIAVTVTAHVSLSLFGLWLAQANRHCEACGLAMVPLPTSWLALSITSASVYHDAPLSGALMILGLTGAWVSFLCFVAWHRRRAPVVKPASEFAVQFAGWSTCMLACVAPLAFS